MSDKLFHMIISHLDYLHRNGLMTSEDLDQLAVFSLSITDDHDKKTSMKKNSLPSPSSPYRTSTEETKRIISDVLSDN